MTDSESKRTEYLRAQMSLGERLDALQMDFEETREILQERVGTLSQCVDVINEALWDASGTVDSPINDLARRVAEIEKGRPQLACVSGFTPGSEGERHEYVSCAELARLRRIEEAARGVDAASQRGFVACSAEALMPFEKLRDALDSEPKR